MKWISIKDKLPEKMHEVLVCYTDGDDDFVLLGQINEQGFWESTYWDDVNGCMLLEYVSHWMPFPKPPK